MYIKKLISNFLAKFGYKICSIISEQEKRLQTLGINTIIDAGANKGQSIEYYQNLLGKKIHIHAFEPLIGAFSVLNSKYQGNPNINLYNLGLGNSIQSLKINVPDERDDSASLLEMKEIHKSIFPFTKKQHIEEINISTLDEILAQEVGLAKVLLKIDVQGYEIEVLKGASKVLPKIDLVICEVSYIALYENQPLITEVINFMESIGFTYYGPLFTYNTSTFKPLQQDAIFINKKSTLHNESN